MNFVVPTERPWWRRKRFLLPLLAALIVAGSLIAALVRSRASTIVIYNETGQPLTQVRIYACGQAASFRDVPNEGSVRMRLAPRGPASAVTLEVADDKEWQWSGIYVEPRGGYRIALRIFPDAQVDAHTHVSWWQTVLLRPH
jgi:hypothetical protein